MLRLPENKKLWYRSIRSKLIALSFFANLVMVTLLTVNSHHAIKTSIEAQISTKMGIIAPLLDAVLGAWIFEQDHGRIQQFLDNLVASPTSEIRYIAVFDRQGETVASSGLLPTKTNLHRPHKEPSLIRVAIGYTIAQTLPLSYYGNPKGSVHFGLSVDQSAMLRTTLTRQNLVIAVLALGLSLILLATFSHSLTRHITSLVVATRRIADADYSRPISVTSQDEIAVLADHFNFMTATVQQRMAELAENEERFRTIFDAAGDSILIHEASSGHILDVNQRVCEMFGCTRAEVLDAAGVPFTSAADLYAIEDISTKPASVTTADPYSFEWLTRRLDNGRQLWVEVNLRHAHIGSANCIIALVRDISERKQYQADLEFLAHHDALTHLPNRVVFSKRLQQAMLQAARKSHLLAVAYLDLDGFKAVNDSLGHATGDKLLIMVAERLSQKTRVGDTVCRLGGDEFALLLHGSERVSEYKQALQRLLAAIAAPYHIDGQKVIVSGSVGITFYPHDDADAETLIRHADQAMYLAKQAGRNRCHVFDVEMERVAQCRYRSLARLEQALIRNEFVLYYQPWVDMYEGAVLGAEALLRWRHPKEGLLAPGSFLEELNQSSLTIPLGIWVIETAVAQLADWCKAGLALTVSINVSAPHLLSPHFSEQLAAILARHPDVPPAALRIEIVETIALEDVARTSAVIADCRRLGVRFALDDFGTGYSSMSYVRNLDVDALKIDQSFVRGLSANAEDITIVKWVIGLAHSFGCEVIAEGVESAEIGDTLLALGCRQAQGYAIARPMPAVDLPGWIAAWDADSLRQAIAQG